LEERVTGIVIRAEAYRESDKLLRIFTPERGLIRAVMKGVKKKTAKLRFFAQPFAFCDFELLESAGRYTVKTCAAVEDFFALSLDPDRYAAGCLCLEAVESAAGAIDSGGLFLLTVKCLKSLLLTPAEPRLIAAKFIQKLLSLAGFYKSPGKPNAAEGTAAALIYDISIRYADELSEVSAAPETAARALTALTGQFERAFETKLKSTGFWHNLT
jgi:DNA repair protein RecO (recombination protein O)